MNMYISIYYIFEKRQVHGMFKTMEEETVYYKLKGYQVLVLNFCDNFS